MTGGQNGLWPKDTERGQEIASMVASHAEESPPLGAKARVWSNLSKKKSRQRKLIGGVLFATSACVAAIVIQVGIRRHDELAIRSTHVHGLQVDEVSDLARVARGMNSTVSVSASRRDGIHYRLDRGQLLVSVVPHRNTNLVVETPRAKIRVKGTVFFVDVDAAGAATVVTGRGLVEVASENSAALVELGTGDRTPKASRSAPSDEEVDALGSAWLEGATFAAPVPVPVPVEPPPLPAAKSVTAEPMETPKADLPAPAAQHEVSASEAPLRLHGAKRHDSDSLRAEAALYDRAWQLLHESGDVPGALTVWEEQRRRFPHGTLRREADTSIVEALIKQGDEPRLRREIDRYLGTYPNSLAAPEMRYIRATWERKSGDCVHALSDFDRALRAPAKRWESDARAQRAECAKAVAPR